MIERRALGRTGLAVSVLGFGGSEIGFEAVEAAAVRRLVLDALDAGLNVIDTAECYRDSEALLGAAVADRRRDFHLFTKCGHFEGTGRDDWRPESLERSIARSLARLRTDHLDVLQTSVNVADQEAIELTLPLAHARGVGVIAKRPIANAAWRTGRRPDNAYHHVYWDRLRCLDYDFLRRPAAESIGTALRFTAALPAVHSLVVGITQPGRWRENAALLEAGPLPSAAFEAIRARWREVADASWVGQR